MHRKLSKLTLLSLVVAASSFYSPRNIEASVFRDDFKSKNLTQGWEWQASPEGKTSWSLTENPGNMTIVNQGGGGLWDNNIICPKLLRKISAADLTITTHMVDYRPTEEWQEAGIYLWQDEKNWYKFQLSRHPDGLALDCAGYIDGKAKEFRTPSYKQPQIWLRIRKKEGQYHFIFSKDGKKYVWLGSVSAEAYTDPVAGLFAANGKDNRARFDFFEIKTEELKYMSPYPLPENNLVSNPSFEAGKGEDPRDWQRIPKDKSRVKWAEQGHWGKRSAIIECGGERWDRWETKLKGVKPNTDYRLSFWAKARGEQLLSVEVFDQKIEMPLAGKWMKFGRLINSKNSQGECALIIMTKGKRGNVWVDDIAVKGPIAKDAVYPKIVAIPAVEASAKTGEDQTVLHDRAVNLIPNGQGEIDSNGDGVPDSWHNAKEGEKYLCRSMLDVPFFDMESEAGKYECLSNHGFKSKHCLQMSVKGQNNWAEWDVEVKGIKPNTKYNLAFWHYNPTRGALSFSCFGSLYQVTHARAFRQWMYHTINLNSGSFSGDTTIGFVLEGRKDKELTALIDNVQLYEGEVPRGAEKYYYVYNFFTGENEAVLDYFTYDNVYVCPQIASCMGLGLRYKFKDENKKPAVLKMHIDLPEGVTLGGWDARYWSSWRKQCKLKTSEVKHNGKTYTRNTMIWPMPKSGYKSYDWTHSSHPGTKHVFWYLQTSLAPGEKRDLYYSMDWESNPIYKDGKLQYRNSETQEPRKVIVECINVPKAPHLDGFINSVGILMGQIRYWPDFFEMLKFLGINWPIIREDTPDAYPADKLREMGFEPAVDKSFCVTGYRKSRRKYKDAVLPTGVDGKPAAKPGMPCLSKRGKAYRESLDSYKKWIDKGVYIFVLDDEGKTECFCDECVKGFKDYLEKAGEKAKYEDPRKFMASPNRESVMYQRWYEYGRWQYGKLLYDARKELEKYMKEKGIEPKRLVIYQDGIPLAMDGHDRYRKKLGMQPPKYLYSSYGKAFDYYGNQIYINCYDRGYLGLPSLGGDTQEYNTREYASCGLKQIPVPGAELTYMDPMDDYQPREVLKYLLMEIAASGIQGWHIYPFYYNLNIGQMLWMNQTLVEMKRAEEIFMKGKPINRFDEEGKALDQLKQTGINSLEDKRKFNWQSLRGLKYKDEAVILAADYSTTDNVPSPVEFEYKVKKPSNVIDLQTGRKVGVITPKKPRYRVILGKDRARWFYVGPKKSLK